MQPVNLEVIRYSDNVLEMLNRNELWKIHSIFNRGALLYSVEPLFIGGVNSSYGPFHMALNQKSLKDFMERISSDRKVSLSLLKSNVKSDFLLDFNASKMYECYIAEHNCNATAEAVKVLGSFLASPERVNGLDMSFCSLIKYGVGGVYKSDEILKDPKTLTAFLLYCIGRGKGLTPSGDDFLIGFLSAFAGWSWLYSTFEDIVREEGLTTDMSYFFFKSALKKRYDRGIINLLNSMYSGKLEAQSKYMQEVADYGHTSGVDTLTGIYYALSCKKDFNGGINAWLK